MSWLQRVFMLMNASGLQPEPATSSYGANLTAIPGRLDRAPQRKSETVLTLPLEYVGIHGEYDPQGLAKRVAQAFDQHSEIRQINTLCIIQHGDRISLLGKVANTDTLRQVIDLAEQVDGTKEVDVRQVVVESETCLQT
ncbi:MAG: hypothetical protein HC827_18030 [Cyanobacteria bacterium RM1_2_2]|nr:hypothetical protein [Cyanobacteria bacterium RM1_2_2]